MMLFRLGRFHVALTPGWGLSAGRGVIFTWLHVGALLFGWVNRQRPAGDDRPSDCSS